MWKRIALAAVAGLFGSGAALAQQSVLDDRAYWAAAFETGRVYAADMTLVAYCMRKDPDAAAVVYLGVIRDMTQVIQYTQQGAISARQAASFVHSVLDATHFAAPETVDDGLEKACVERNVEKAYFSLQPIGWPLTMRPPFKK